MNQDNYSQPQTAKHKETVIKILLFAGILYFFTFIGSAIFNQIFIETTLRIIIFLTFYILTGAVIGFLPHLFERFKTKADGEEGKAVNGKKLLIQILLGAALAGLLCFLAVILPYLCQFPQIAKGVISQIFAYAFLAFLVIFFCRMENRPLISLGFKKKNIILQLLIGTGLGIFTCFAFTLLPILCKITPAENWVSKPIGGYQIAFSVISNLLLIGTIEEFIFRGYIQTTINASAKRKAIGVVIAAIIFGVWHIFNGNIINVCMTFLIGLILGFTRAYLKNCSLMSVMLAHALNNILIMVVALIYL